MKKKIVSLIIFFSLLSSSYSIAAEKAQINHQDVIREILELASSSSCCCSDNFSKFISIKLIHCTENNNCKFDLYFQLLIPIIILRNTLPCVVVHHLLEIVCRYFCSIP